MATYIGFYSSYPTFSDLTAENGRKGAGLDKAFLDKVQSLPEQLPDGTVIIGSYGTMATDRPAVMIVEADDPSGLAFISNYYTGYLQFNWAPATVIGGSRAERDTWRKGVEG